MIEQTIKDIKFNLQPNYSEEDLKMLYDYKTKYSIVGKNYTPGIIGMNNLNGTDYANAVFQLLNVVKPLREFLLLSR